MSGDHLFDVNRLLSDTEPLIAVRQHTTVDTTALVDLIRQMGDKITEQDAEIRELRAVVRSLSNDMIHMKEQASEYKLLRGDVQHLIDDVETLSVVLKLPKVPNPVRDGILRASAAPTQNDSLYRATGRTGVTPVDSRLASRRESEVHQRTPQRFDPVDAQPPAQISPVPRVHQEPSSQKHHAPSDRPKTGLMLESDENAGGMRVMDVKEHSAAHEAGIIPDELIISAQGESVANSDTFRDIMRSKRPGDSLTLRVQGHSGATRTVVLALRGRAPSYVDDA